MISSSWSVKTVFLFFNPGSLSEVEVDLDIQTHGDRFAVLARRLEYPLEYGSDGFLIETVSHRLADTQNLDRAIRLNNGIQNDCSFVTSLPRFLGVVGTHFLDEHGF